MPEFGRRPNFSSRSVNSFSSYNSSCHFLQRKRTLDEFPMEHSCKDVARLSATRRQQKEANEQRLVSKCEESQQLKSYSRNRFETALKVKGTSLPPPTPDENRIFWDEVTPTWASGRHHSVTMTPRGVTSPVTLTSRPGSEPLGTVAERQRREVKSAFNHIRGSNSIYPSIRQLLREKNEDYRVISARPLDQKIFDIHQFKDTSLFSECCIVPLHPPYKRDANSFVPEPDIRCKTHFSDSEHADSVDEYAEPVIDHISSLDAKIPSEEMTTDEQAEDAEEEPSPPWRCWVDDATVSSIAPSPEPEVPVEDITAPPSPAPDPVLEASTPPLVPDNPSKARLSISSSKQKAKASSTSVEKRDSAMSPMPEEPVGKRKSSGKLKKKKGRKGTPEPPTPEVVELPPPPPPATPPIVEVVEEVAVEEEIKEEEVEPVLPSYICPSSIPKSTETEIKLWLRKSTFSAASRTLPII